MLRERKNNSHTETRYINRKKEEGKQHSHSTHRLKFADHTSDY